MNYSPKSMLLLEASLISYDAAAVNRRTMQQTLFKNQEPQLECGHAVPVKAEEGCKKPETVVEPQPPEYQFRGAMWVIDFYRCKGIAIGRAPDNYVVLQDVSVSNVHLSVEWSMTKMKALENHLLESQDQEVSVQNTDVHHKFLESAVTVIDRSTNGTFVETTTQLSKGQPTAVPLGHMISLGRGRIENGMQVPVFEFAIKLIRGDSPVVDITQRTPRYSLSSPPMRKIIPKKGARRTMPAPAEVPAVSLYAADGREDTSTPLTTAAGGNRTSPQPTEDPHLPPHLRGIHIPSASQRLFEDISTPLGVGREPKIASKYGAHGRMSEQQQEPPRRVHHTIAGDLKQTLEEMERLEANQEALVHDLEATHMEAEEYRKKLVVSEENNAVLARQVEDLVKAIENMKSSSKDAGALQERLQEAEMNYEIQKRRFESLQQQQTATISEKQALVERLRNEETAREEYEIRNAQLQEHLRISKEKLDEATTNMRAAQNQLEGVREEQIKHTMEMKHLRGQLNQERKENEALLRTKDELCERINHTTQHVGQLNEDIKTCHEAEAARKQCLAIAKLSLQAFNDKVIASNNKLISFIDEAVEFPIGAMTAVAPPADGGWGNRDWNDRFQMDARELAGAALPGAEFTAAFHAQDGFMQSVATAVDSPGVQKPHEVPLSAGGGIRCSTPEMTAKPNPQLDSISLPGERPVTPIRSNPRQLATQDDDRDLTKQSRKRPSSWRDGTPQFSQKRRLMDSEIEDQENNRCISQKSTQGNAECPMDGSIVDGVVPRKLSSLGDDSDYVVASRGANLATCPQEENAVADKDIEKLSLQKSSYCPPADGAQDEDIVPDATCESGETAADPTNGDEGREAAMRVKTFSQIKKHLRQKNIVMPNGGKTEADDTID